MILCLLFLVSDFFLLTVPKSGSHLAINVLEHLTGRLPRFVNDHPHHDVNYFKWYRQCCYFPWSHFDLSLRYEQFCPDAKGIVLIRDLRDVFVSLAYFMKTELDYLLGVETSFEERLAYLFYHDLTWYPMSVMVKEADRWFEKEGILVLRFEELVEGVGAERIQNFLGIEKFHGNLTKCIGNSPTYREGKVGSWETHFSEETIELFQSSIYEDYQKKWGYTLD